ncbi:MAG: alpha/beta fold hydrolase [Gammaproteobacteria bacterium SHHR-1]
MSKAELRSFFCRLPRPGARLRLFCFPHAGGGVTAFHAWPELLPEGIELHAAQLPGRERRRHEPLQTDMAAMADEFAADMLAMNDRPIALFGFSMGALLAYEVARRLSGQAGIGLDHLLVAARRAPHLPYDRAIHHLPDEAFIQELQQKYGGLPDVVRESRELLDYFLPIIRADLTLLETYCHSPGTPLDCRISVYGGTQDSSTTPAQLDAWSQHSRWGSDTLMIEGGHFFPQANLEALLADISRRLLPTGAV